MVLNLYCESFNRQNLETMVSVLVKMFLLLLAFLDDKVACEEIFWKNFDKSKCFLCQNIKEYVQRQYRITDKRIKRVFDDFPDANVGKIGRPSEFLDYSEKLGVFSGYQNFNRQKIRLFNANNMYNRKTNKLSRVFHSI